MKQILSEFFLWSEVWAMLIPLGVLVFRKTPARRFRPVVVYLVVGLFLFFLADFSWKAKGHMNLPAILQNNNFLYNLLSILRTVCFIRYFQELDRPILPKARTLFPVIYIAFVVLDVIFLENFRDFSRNLHVAEVIILLLFCISYFIRVLQSDTIHHTRDPSFWVITGLFIYEAVNFFVFIVYAEIAKSDSVFAFKLWYVHNIAHIIFSILITKGLYESGKHRS